ncbi:MAG: endonuclease V [Sulfolobales archaeon]|jgi:deoxyribonuclease V
MVQEILAKKVVVKPLDHKPNIIVGLDVSYDKNNRKGFAAAVAVDIRDLKVVDLSIVSSEISFPYIPGYLAFREAPLMFKAFLRLRNKDNTIIMVNGHGIAHPRGLGIASHIGVVLNRPSIGVAKRLLVGEVSRIGGREVIIYNNRVVGIVVSSEKSKDKYYVTIGHKVSIEDLEYYIERTFNQRYRRSKPPYPIYLADKISREAARGIESLYKWSTSRKHIFDESLDTRFISL